MNSIVLYIDAFCHPTLNIQRKKVHLKTVNSRPISEFKQGYGTTENSLPCDSQNFSANLQDLN